MDVPAHYQLIHNGFWGILDSTLPYGVAECLPSAAMMFRESVHFAELALDVHAKAEFQERVN